MTFKEIRQMSGLSLTEFSKAFNIPYRTLQHWEKETRKCPDYVLELIVFKIKKEQA